MRYADASTRNMRYADASTSKEMRYSATSNLCESKMVVGK
jgi:hypothetical protein